MKARIVLTCLVTAGLMLSGCSQSDKKAFERARQVATEQSFRDYISEYPEGRYAAEANKLLRRCVVSEAITAYRSARNAARVAAGKGDWPQALRRWRSAAGAVDVEKDVAAESVQIRDYQRETREHIAQCRKIIEEPITLSDTKVTGTYHYRSADPDIPGRRYTSVRVSGKLTNNCPFAISDIVLLFELVAETPVKVNTTTGEDVGHGGYETLASVQRTVCKNQAIAPGQSSPFSYRVPISANADLTRSSGDELTFYSPEPEYSVEVKSYKSR